MDVRFCNVEQQDDVQGSYIRVAQQGQHEVDAIAEDGVVVPSTFFTQDDLVSAGTLF